jgi:hypothetical protein
MSDHVMTPLEILEQGHKEAEAALAALKEQWKADDAALKAERAAILEAHAQGARDRDAVRKQMGGASLIEAEKAAEAARKAAADAAAERTRLASLPTQPPPRASSLPVQPLAALGQTDKADDKPATKAT